MVKSISTNYMIIAFAQEMNAWKKGLGQIHFESVPFKPFQLILHLHEQFANNTGYRFLCVERQNP